MTTQSEGIERICRKLNTCDDFHVNGWRWTQSGGWELEIRVHHPQQDTWHDVRVFVEKDRNVQKCGVFFERSEETPADLDIESMVDRINSPTLVGKFMLLKGTRIAFVSQQYFFGRFPPVRLLKMLLIEAIIASGAVKDAVEGELTRKQIIQAQPRSSDSRRN